MLTPEELDEIQARYPRADPGEVRAYLARVPASWALLHAEDDGAAFRRGSLQVIVSLAVYDDHRLWLHVSVSGVRSSGQRFLPDWEDLKRVKHDFVGEERWAYQVLPPGKQYVNICPYALHLFALLDGTSALPDFCRGSGQL